MAIVPPLECCAHEWIPTAPEEITQSMLAAAFAALSSHECEVLLWIVRSNRDSEIAFILGIHATTASSHVRNLLAKLAVESRHADHWRQ